MAWQRIRPLDETYAGWMSLHHVATALAPFCGAGVPKNCDTQENHDLLEIPE